MKQLLLRVPEDLHRRLAARAAREERSINAVATELLELTVDPNPGDRQARLRARAAAMGILRTGPTPARRLTPEEREEIIESTRGWGPMADELIREQRDRL